MSLKEDYSAFEHHNKELIVNKKKGKIGKVGGLTLLHA
jgi:hypothetical protein